MNCGTSREQEDWKVIAQTGLSKVWDNPHDEYDAINPEDL